MSSFSLQHWIIVLIIVVLVFGTKKLRNVGKDLGGAVHDFKQGLNGGTDDKNAKKDEVIEHKKDEDRAQSTFDLGLGELLLVGVVALIVLGPERLPQAACTAGRLVGKLQGFVNNVKQELNTQAELDELRKVKQEFEAAASEFRDGIKDLGDDARKNLNDISDGLKPWEHLSEQKAPADFGVDEFGNPLPDLAPGSTESESAAQVPEESGAAQTQEPVGAESAESEQDHAWRGYLAVSVSPAPTVEVSYVEASAADIPPLYTISLRKQAMSRKHDMCPRFHAKPKLRVCE